MGDLIMSVCKGCYSIVKDVTFVVKGAKRFFVSSIVLFVASANEECQRSR